MGKVTVTGVQYETPIYRYLSIERFLEMVELGINTMPHVSMWEDPNEAYLIRSRIVENSVQGDGREVRKWYEQYRTFYGQSWMVRSDESDVLWRAYGNRGQMVRIESTVGRLCKTLEQNLVNDRTSGYDLNAFIGAVSYVDDMRDVFAESEEAKIKTLFVKRREFSDENEFRVIVKVDDKEGIPNKTEQQSVVINGGLLRYRVSINELIKSALLDPCCSLGKRDEIFCRVRNSGSDFDIKKSCLFDWPKPAINLSKSDTSPDTHVTAEENTNSVNETASFESSEKEFWRLFQTAYRDGKSEFTDRSLPDRRYWGFPVGGGLSYFLTFNRTYAKSELYIDSTSKEWNEKTVAAIKAELEKVGKTNYSFEPLENRRACRIAVVNDSFQFTDRTCWNAACTWLCESLDKLRTDTEEMARRIVGM